LKVIFRESVLSCYGTNLVGLVINFELNQIEENAYLLVTTCK